MDQELEVKFRIPVRERFRQALRRRGAQLKHPRVLETNLRFDNADGSFSSSFQVLRLRQDTVARLTYKSPQGLDGGVLSRREIEFGVDDFEAAQRFLEAIGYHVYAKYEKYRETFVLNDVEITIDEMPFGVFTEMEAETPEQLRETAESLSLPWDERINISYMEIFDRLRRENGWGFNDLTFENLQGLEFEL